MLKDRGEQTTTKQNAPKKSKLCALQFKVLHGLFIMQLLDYVPMFLCITKIILTCNLSNNLISKLWILLFLVISSTKSYFKSSTRYSPFLPSHLVFFLEVSLSFPHVSIRLWSFIYPIACHIPAYFRAWYAVAFLPHTGITTLNSWTILCFLFKNNKPTIVELMTLSKSIHIYWMNPCWENKWMDASYLDHI